MKKKNENLSKTYRAENGMLVMGLQSFATQTTDAEGNLTSTGNAAFNTAFAQSIDFATSFDSGIAGIQKILNIVRKIPMPSGSVIKTYKSSVTLDGSKVPAGAIIPLSLVKQEPAESIELVWDKERKATPAEDIQRYGLNVAVANTDALFIKELQKKVRTDFFALLAKGTGTATGEGLQAASARAWGGVSKVFEDDAADVIGFFNTDDVADYLAKADITVQTMFGMQYIENFLNFKVALISSLVPKGTIYATAAQNLVIAYADMANSEVSSTFGMYTDETGLLGVTHDINKQRLTAETIVATAVVLFPERMDGVIKSTVTEASV